eukprot:scaffold72440_cov23-Tisochrysis_lutea.AAC.1
MAGGHTHPYPNMHAHTYMLTHTHVRSTAAMPFGITLPVSVARLLMKMSPTQFASLHPHHLPAVWCGVWCGVWCVVWCGVVVLYVIPICCAP